MRTWGTVFLLLFDDRSRTNILAIQPLLLTFIVAFFPLTRSPFGEFPLMSSSYSSFPNLVNGILLYNYGCISLEHGRSIWIVYMSINNLICRPNASPLQIHRQICSVPIIFILSSSSPLTCDRPDNYAPYRQWPLTATIPRYLSWHQTRSRPASEISYSPRRRQYS